MEQQKPLVERKLHWCSKELIVQVTAPTQRNPRADWHCWLNITMAPGKRVHHERVRGVDSWQCIWNAMYFAQRTIEIKFPEAYAYGEGDGGFFPYVVQHDIPDPYFKRLRDHLESERARMTQELFDEFKRNKLPRETLRRRRKR